MRSAEYGVTRERIRQIESRPCRSCATRRRSRVLRDYLD